MPTAMVLEPLDEVKLTASSMMRKLVALQALHVVIEMKGVHNGSSRSINPHPNTSINSSRSITYYNGSGIPGKFRATRISRSHFRHLIDRASCGIRITNSHVHVETQ